MIKCNYLAYKQKVLKVMQNELSSDKLCHVFKAIQIKFYLSNCYKYST